MFDFDAGKLLIVGVIALIFIPPKDLPRVLRQAGQFVGRMRRMATEFQGQFMEAMREADMADLRKEAQKLADAARLDTGLDAKAHDLNRQMTSAVAARHAAERSADAPAAPVSAPDKAPATGGEDSARAFEDLRSELRPLVEETRRDDARREPGEAPGAAHQPHSV